MAEWVGRMTTVWASVIMGIYSPTNPKLPPPPLPPTGRGGGLTHVVVRCLGGLVDGLASVGADMHVGE